MLYGYKLLIKDQLSDSTVWNYKLIKLLNKAIDVLNIDIGAYGAKILKHTLHFKLFTSLRELDSPYKAEDLVKTH